MLHTVQCKISAQPHNEAKHSILQTNHYIISFKCSSPNKSADTLLNKCDAFDKHKELKKNPFHSMSARRIYQRSISLMSSRSSNSFSTNPVGTFRVIKLALCKLLRSRPLKTMLLINLEGYKYILTNIYWNLLCLLPWKPWQWLPYW